MVLKSLGYMKKSKERHKEIKAVEYEMSDLLLFALGYVLVIIISFFLEVFPTEE